MQRLILILVLSFLFPRACEGTEANFEYQSSRLLAEAKDVEISGNIAYALFTPGLLIIDISDPSNPELLAHYFFQEAPEDIRIIGNTAVVALGSGGIQIIEISDPYNPTAIGSYPSDGESMGLDFQGDTLYIANGSKGLLVLSIEDPETPIFISELEGVTPSVAVDARGEYAYLAAWQNGLYVVQLTDLQIVAWLRQPPYLTKDVRVSDNFAYLADYVGLVSVDISNPENPILTSYNFTSGRALDLYIENPYLFLADDVAGFYILDIFLNPGYPDLVSSYNTPDDARGISVDNGITVVADDYRGLQIVDVSIPETPFFLSEYSSAGESRGAVIVEDLGYIAQGAEGLSIFNIQDPEQPELVGSYKGEDLSFIFSLDVVDSIAALANGSKGLLLVNVSDPSSPSYLGEVETGRQLTEVKIMGDMAYIVDGDFKVIDISNPLAPEVISSYITIGASRDLALAGNKAFIAEFADGISSFDISNPQDSLVLLDHLETPGYATGIEINDNRIYLADDHGGFRIFQYDSGGRLEEISQIELGDDAINIALDTNVNIAFLTLEGGEVVAVDVRDIEFPELIARFPTPGKSAAIEMMDSTVIVCDVSSIILLKFNPTSVGMKENSLSVPGFPINQYYLSQNYPNPFNPSTTIDFSIPNGEAKRVIIKIYNLRGRLVKTLLDQKKEPGFYSVHWDGKDESGNEVSSGVFFYNLNISDLTLLRKMVLVE
jgi:hypothetical protein